MTSHTTRRAAPIAAALLVLFGAALGQAADRDWNGDDSQTRIDRYLDIEIWPNHQDGDYYVGDNIWINFRVNRDAFVAIYSVDTRGRVNMLFPASPGGDNYVYGGVTYTIPDSDDNYDLVVAGPEGVENIQAIASRERFPIPNWYPHSGLECDREDRHDFMDYVNSRYFVDYGGQRFAYDRTAVYVDEWEPYYFRPVYYPRYPSWTVCGNVYIDYPWGATIYVDGVYWGCAPLYLPRVWVGWHTITVYDRWGWCWESDIHISRFHTVVLDRTIVAPRQEVRSKFKEVRESAYREPELHGYPKFREKEEQVFKAAGVGSSKSVGRSHFEQVETYVAPTKKYARGTTSLTKTERGFESSSITAGPSKKSSPSSGSWGGKSTRDDFSTGSGRERKMTEEGSADYGGSKSGYSGSSKKDAGSGRGSFDTGSQKSTSTSSGQYRKKSGGGVTKQSDVGQKTTAGGGKSKKDTGTIQKPSGGDTKSSGGVKPAPQPSPTPPSAPSKGDKGGGSKKGR